MSKCFICNNSAKVNNSNIHSPEYDCPTCGEYNITDVAMNTIPKERYPKWSQLLQKYIRENQDAGKVSIKERTIKSIFGY